jgi:UDP-glucose 4-epimerase
VRYLVTGGAGFIGSNLADRLLAEGHEVDVIDDLSSGSIGNLSEARAQADGALKIHNLDIRSRDTVSLIERREPEVVVHLAAQLSVRESVRDPVVDAEINLIGLLNVLEGARVSGARKVVFTSSGGTIYGNVPAEDLPVREGYPQRPLSPYGIAKKASTDYLNAYRELHELDFTSLALSNVYGPRQNPHGEAGVVAIFAGLLLDGRQCTIYGDGSKTRDYVYVDDVVDAIARATERGGGLLCNIGTGVETSDLQVYETVASAVGVQGPPMHASDRPGDLQRIALDHGRATMQLGWQPFTSFADGIAQTVEWFRAQREET